MAHKDCTEDVVMESRPATPVTCSGNEVQNEHLVQHDNDPVQAQEDNKFVDNLASNTTKEHEEVHPRKRSASEAEFDSLIVVLNYTPPDIEVEPPPAKIAKKTPRVAKKKVPVQEKVNLDFLENQNKPEPWAQPEVWADNRQSLCETTRFHSWQSGTYHLDGIAKGMLLDRDRSAGGYMDEEIIICRTGGGFEMNKNGESIQTKDHDFNHSSVRCFLGSLKAKKPLDIVVGNNNTYCPSAMPHRYCVLGQFYVTAVWIERRNGHIVCRVRLEKCDLDTLGWWAPVGTPAPSLPRAYDVQAVRQMCKKCGKESAKLYKQSWYCLDPVCNPKGLLADGSSLTKFDFDEAFLKQRTYQDSSFEAAQSAITELPKSDSKEVDFGTGRNAWAGQVCRACGRCLTRIYWDRWECGANGCTWILPMEHAIVPLDFVKGEPGVDGPTSSMDKCQSPAKKVHRRITGQYVERSFELLPGNTVTHLVANEHINSRPNGPDDLFYRLQKEQIGLRRIEMQNSPIEGTKLTKHFAHNFGSPYKYIAAVSTTAFKDAPEPIVLGLSRLDWAAKAATQFHSVQPFNELLLVAYMAQMQMGWHDDGEAGLGQIVASLSLGATCTMKWRLKAKYYLPKHMQMKGIENYDPTKPVRPGSKFWKERMELNAKYQKITPIGFHRKKVQLYKAYHKSKAVNCPTLISFTLKHGDFMIMNGPIMQKYYEHCIEGGEKLRFAMTGRFIDPVLHQVSPEDAWKSIYEIDPANVYHGD